MLLLLPVLSFLSAGLLSVFLSVPRINSSFVNTSLVVWLMVGNLIHGTNALVWAGNTDIHIPVWCDIGLLAHSYHHARHLWLRSLFLVTNILIGANVALPGACVCISVHLEHMSSRRPILSNWYIKKATLLFQVIFCFFFPIVYMSLRESRLSVSFNWKPHFRLHRTRSSIWYTQGLWTFCFNTSIHACIDHHLDTTSHRV